MWCKITQKLTFATALDIQDKPKGDRDKRKKKIRNKTRMRKRRRISATSIVFRVMIQGMMRMHAQQDRISQMAKRGIATLHCMPLHSQLTKFWIQHKMVPLETMMWCWIIKWMCIVHPRLLWNIQDADETIKINGATCCKPKIIQHPFSKDLIPNLGKGMYFYRKEDKAC